MLTSLSIRDFALIAELTFTPGSGFVALTGETGAGKSILIDAIASLLGERADTRQVRTGSEKATLFAEIGRENGEVITLGRELFANGRSVARVDGRVVPLSQLRQTGESQVAIHGQRESLGIFREATHRGLLDRFFSQKLSPLIENYEALRQRRIEIDRQLSGIETDPVRRAERLELLRFQVEEISAAKLKPGEEEDLRLRQKKLQALISLYRDVAAAADALSGGTDGGVSARLNRSLALLAKPAKMSKAISGVRERVLELTDRLREETGELLRLLDRLETDPAEAEEVEKRLEQIGKLTYKYGGSIEHVLAFEAKARAELAADEEQSALREIRLKESSHLDEQLTEADEHLHKERLKAGNLLARAIEAELSDLGMANVRFDIEVELQADKPFAGAEHGRDLVRFLIQPNQGEPLMPLAEIASGGEAARVLLAIKAILAAVDDLDVLIFDEIDAGVSGRTSTAIGRKLKQLGCVRQVFAVTHSAPIAALADELYVVAKHEEDGRTLTTVTRADAEKRITEVARLLSGQPDDLSARELASRLIAGRKDETR